MVERNFQNDAAIKAFFIQNLERCLSRDERKQATIEYYRRIFLPVVATEAAMKTDDNRRVYIEAAERMRIRLWMVCTVIARVKKEVTYGEIEKQSEEWMDARDLGTKEIATEMDRFVNSHHL